MKTFFTLLLCLCLSSVYGQNELYNFDLNDTGYKKAFFIDTVHYLNNKWQVGKPQKSVFDSARSYPNVLVTDTLNPCSANDTSVVVLRIPNTVPVTNFPWGTPLAMLFDIGFYYQLNLHAGDTVKIEVKFDSVSDWEKVPDSLSSSIRVQIDSPFNTSSKGWRNFDMSTLYYFTNRMQDTTLIRFTLITGADTTARDGWMMDDFYTHYWWEDVPIIHNDNLIHTYPNPSNGDFTIRSTNTDKAEIFIYDLSGRQVWQQPNTGLNNKIHVVLPDGIYVLKYQTDREVAVKRLVLRR